MMESDGIIVHKPDEKDVYDKPNVYDDNDNDNKTASLPQEVLEDLIIRPEFVNGKRPPIKTNDSQDETAVKLTNALISHAPVSTTTLVTSVSPSNSSTTSNSSSTATNTSTTDTLKQLLNKKPMEDLLSYDLRKVSLVRPFEQDVYIKGTKELVYKKVQPHSYSWGFQNVLYKQSIKVAEARRRAFKKQITIEWGDFPITEDSFTKDEPSTVSLPTSITTKSHQLFNKTKSHLLFTYETEFEGFVIRWKRSSLLSHDLACELQYNDKKWRMIAAFDSHRMGYLIHLGELTIDKNALNLVKQPEYLEAHIIITCCTLIDLMREVVEKAVGINKGGVVGSE